MKNILKKIKPESGLAHALHFILNALLPILVLLLVRINFVPIAIAVVLLAKWRMFAIRPKYWLANIRSNLVDILIGLSVVAFMAGTTKLYTQAFWALFYIGWLLWLKPKSKPIPVMIQALLAQALGLIAFFRSFPSASLIVIVLVTWVICYASARHFLGAFEERHIRPMAQIWAWFGAIMAWILGHWMIQYLFLPQVAMILTVMGYGLATLYYLHENKKLKSALKTQLIAVMGILLLIIIIFSDWQDKTV